MNIANLQRAADFAREDERMERRVAAYRKADSINISLTATYSNGSRMPDRVEQHQISLTAAEIGDHIVEALQRRLAKVRVELAEFGVTVGEAAGEPGRQ